VQTHTYQALITYRMIPGEIEAIIKAGIERNRNHLDHARVDNLTRWTPLSSPVLLRRQSSSFVNSLHFRWLSPNHCCRFPSSLVNSRWLLPILCYSCRLYCPTWSTLFHSRWLSSTRNLCRRLSSFLFNIRQISDILAVLSRQPWQTLVDSHRLSSPLVDPFDSHQLLSTLVRFHNMTWHDMLCYVMTFILAR